MGEWQDGELASEEDVAFLIAAHADVNRDSVEAEEIEAWPVQHGFDYDALLLDNGRIIMDRYIDANPGQTYTQAVTVIIDKNMRIRHVGGTYDEANDENLDLILELLAEEPEL